MNIIEALNKARELDAGITNPELKRAGIFLYSNYVDTPLEVRRIDDGFKGVDGRAIPDWRPTPEELCYTDWELFTDVGNDESKKSNSDGSVKNESLPNMSEEKAKLVNILLQLIDNTISSANDNGYKYDDPMICKLPDIGKIVADLVR